MNKLREILRKAGKPTVSYRCQDGTRLLVLPYGGRMLGLYSPHNDMNFYWSHPALNSAATAREFYAGDQWHNSGGDRTWLAPEVDLFFPNFPKLDKYFQQRALDPGRYQVVKKAGGFELTNHLRVHFSRLKKDANLKITKSFGPAPNPLRHERGVDLKEVEYAGYTQHTSLELVGKKKTSRVQVGLWSMLQLPHGGDFLIPTFGRSKPYHIFSLTGTIPASDLITRDGLIRYRARQKSEHKIGVRTISTCGRMAYVYQTGKTCALIIRNFAVNPSGEYVDVPWKEPDCLGFAVQACNVNSGLGAFSELEYHIPAIGYRTGLARCHDAAQIWAFRGPAKKIRKIRKLLLGG